METIAAIAQWFRRAALAVLCLPLCLASGLTVASAQANIGMGPPSPGQRCVTGFYDGGGFELSAGLELRPDHRFRYGLSYGAIDEEAHGTWALGQGGVLLTSDPVTAPRFALVGEASGEASGDAGHFHIALDVPEGLSRPFFAALVRFSDGHAIQRQLGEEGLDLDLTTGRTPVSLTLLLPIYDLESETFPLKASAGGAARFRFEPNDLGRVAFDKTLLTYYGDDLLLGRHTRQITFRRGRSDCD